MAEWFKAVVLKTIIFIIKYHGFESHSVHEEMTEWLMVLVC